MVTPILPDPWEVHRDRNPLLSEVVSGPDTGQQEELRGSRRAGTHNHLATRVDSDWLAMADEFNADDAMAIDQERRREDASPYR